MTLSVLAFLVLVAAFVIGSLTSISAGLLALVAAFGVGSLAAGLPLSDVIGEFPAGLFLILVGATLLFGLGVAGGIHLEVRETEKGGGAFDTPPPRATLISALTTIGSFGSIALSSHPGTSSMGALLTIAISLSLVCTLVVLPALMNVWPPARSASAT